MKNKFYKYKQLPEELNIIITNKGYGKTYFEINNHLKFYLKELKDKIKQENDDLKFINKYRVSEYPIKFYKNEGQIELIEYLLDYLEN